MNTCNEAITPAALDALAADIIALRDRALAIGIHTGELNPRYAAKFLEGARTEIIATRDVIAHAQQQEANA